jgi:hypothetical protein
MAAIVKPVEATAGRQRWRGFLRRLETLIEMRWPVAAYRIINAVALVALGAMIEHAAHSTVAVVFIVYFLVTVVIEFGLSETSKDIERRVSELADERNRRLATDLETYAAAENFLTTRLRRNTGAVSVLRSGDRELISVATGSIAKLPAINDTLRDLCESLSAVCSKNRGIPRPDAWFRATYMEVSGPTEDQRLEYFGWHTLDGSPPKSMTLGITYRKGEGCAGAAWEKSRPVIEDFKDRHEWKENYPHQSSNYTSMICVPVVRGYGNNMGEVIGVITVDTHVDLYFGNKDDRTEEDKIARSIRPYGTYIAFISAVDGAVKDLVAQLGGTPSAATLPATAKVAIPPSQPDANANDDSSPE